MRILFPAFTMTVTETKSPELHETASTKCKKKENE